MIVFGLITGLLLMESVRQYKKDPVLSAVCAITGVTVLALGIWVYG